ncbi:MAG: hypothetical protein QOF55_2597 [Thermoleophilaceae bacterium]|jgi:hypothetical protein|nr:hypothetical protein [Thermoleophilaceae bacterium]
MGLLTRLMGKGPQRTGGGLAADARAMRVALAGIDAELARVHGPGAAVDLRALVGDLLEGEVEAPTADVAELIRLGDTPDEFYERELKPSWEGLGEAQRAARVEGFVELSTMMDAPGAAAGLPPEMIPRVHTKTLLLAWAFDETYGYLAALARS